MRSNPVIAIAIGALLLLIGGFMQFTGGPPKADPTLVAQCRLEMTNRGGNAEMIEKCKEKAFASLITATDAQSAAQNISAANRSEVGGNALSMFVLGLGLVLFGFGLVQFFAKKRAASAGTPQQ